MPVLVQRSPPRFWLRFTHLYRLYRFAFAAVPGCRTAVHASTHTAVPVAFGWRLRCALHGYTFNTRQHRARFAGRCTYWFLRSLVYARWFLACWIGSRVPALSVHTHAPGLPFVRVTQHASPFPYTLHALHWFGRTRTLPHSHSLRTGTRHMALGCTHTLRHLVHTPSYRGLHCIYPDAAHYTTLTYHFAALYYVVPCIWLLHTYRGSLFFGLVCRAHCYTVLPTGLHSCARLPVASGRAMRADTAAFCSTHTHYTTSRGLPRYIAAYLVYPFLWVGSGLPLLVSYSGSHAARTSSRFPCA